MRAPQQILEQKKKQIARAGGDAFLIGGSELRPILRFVRDRCATLIWPELGNLMQKEISAEALVVFAHKLDCRRPPKMAFVSSVGYTAAVIEERTTAVIELS